MGSPAKKFATYEDLLKVPDDLIAEIIAGELITSPRPSPHHGHASYGLGLEIGTFHKGKGGLGGWWIHAEPEIHLQDDILVPDLAGWRKELFPQLPIEGAHFNAAPNWVCEILSPSTARIDRIRKLPIYHREKIDHVWLIDPLINTLEVYKRNENTWILLKSFAGNDVVRAEPFDAIEIDLGSLWLPGE